MSIRTRLLALFIALAVGPLLAVGLFGYVQPRRALEAMLVQQAAGIADESARTIDQRLSRRESDAILLSENAESQRLYAAAAQAGPREALARAQVDTFFRDAFGRLSTTHRFAELRATSGRTLYRIGDGQSAPATEPSAVLTSVMHVRDVADPATGAVAGRLLLATPAEVLLPRQLLDRHVGSSGYTMVVDRSSGSVLHHSSPSARRQLVREVAHAEGWPDGVARLAEGRGSFRFRHRDTLRVAAFSTAAREPWTVIAVGTVDEFSPPFAQAGTLQLIVVLLVAGVATMAFVPLLGRATRSLEQLTAAADEVGRGNLSPALPPASRDEVGRLAHTFGTMTERIRDMIAQIESSRQMAVLGEFASQVAHEIRNPLTSIKLNLQGLSRDAQSGLLPERSATSVQLSLREIDRLDGVVHGVLDLARVQPQARESIDANALVADAVQMAQTQASDAGIAIVASPPAAETVVAGDPGQLRAAILELLLNAIAVTPRGGRITVETSRVEGERRQARIIVCDTGPGVPLELRDRIFQPFFTRRAGGTGLGLPIARRTAESHGGSLELGDADVDGGATFVLALPLAGNGDE